MAKEKGEKPKELTDLPGVGAAMADKLIEGGYRDIMALATAPVNVVKELTGLGEITVRKIITSARDMSGMGFISASELATKRKNVFYLKTGSASLDELLGGGMESGSIIECFGEFGSAKTQLAHQLSVNIQLPEYKGTPVYIDTEGSFRPQRITQMSKALKLDENKTLDNIKYARAYTSDHQMVLAEKLTELLEKDKNVKLVIIDSLTACFRSEFLGRGTLSERQQKLNSHISFLRKFADLNNIIIFVTNQVMIDPAQMFGDPTKSVGGHIVGHASVYRIYLRKAKRGRIARLVDAPHLPDGEAVFQVTEEGIQD